GDRARQRTGCTVRGTGISRRDGGEFGAHCERAGGAGGAAKRVVTWQVPDTDDDSDLARRARAEAGQNRRLLDALYAMQLRPFDHGFVVRLRVSDLVTIAAADRDRLDRLAWQHRRDLPDELRPKLPAFDPIVREM